MSEENRMPHPQEIADFIEAASGYFGAAFHILSEDGQNVKSWCSTFATEELAEWLNKRDPGLAQFHYHQTRHPRPVGGMGHAWIEDENCETIVDPTAGQFFARVPPEFVHLFAGNMFIGDRKQLEALVTHPETKLKNISATVDKRLSFGRIWGK